MVGRSEDTRIEVAEDTIEVEDEEPHRNSFPIILINQDDSIPTPAGTLSTETNIRLTLYCFLSGDSHKL